MAAHYPAGPVYCNVIPYQVPPAQYFYNVPTESLNGMTVIPTVTVEMLQNMMLSHEQSNSLTKPVELGHGEPDPEESLSPNSTSTLKRSHWRNVKKAEACSEPKCHKKFGRMDRKRNCCMCGDVFCRNCTRFRRKLSPDATPDPELGVQCHVCYKCFSYQEHQGMGQLCHWTPEFSYLRAQVSENKKARRIHASSLPISALGTDKDDLEVKTERVRLEIQRLCLGYEANCSWISSFVSDILKIPAWQKSEHWVDDNRSHQCHKCHTAFKKFQTKTNCRVCGQVYCKYCTCDQIVLYMVEGDPNAKWGINAYSHIPEHQKLALLPVCVECTLELKEMLQRELEKQLDDDWDAQEDFMDSLNDLHAVLHRIKSRIESWLPQYQKLVDSMDIIDGSARSTQSKSPINEIAKSQSNLSDQFSHLASESQKLRNMKPHSATQERLLKYITTATYSFYQENMYMFKVARHRLGEMMPIETLDKIQMSINKMSMERVHIFIRQLTFEAMNLEMSYKLVSSNITPPLVNAVDILELRLEDFFDRIGENWKKHCEAVHQMIREDFQGTNPDGKKKRRIKLPERVPRSPFRNVIIQYKILTQCSHFLNEVMRELSAKTPETFMDDVKDTVKGVVTEFTKQVTALRSNHPQVFSRVSAGQCSLTLSPTHK